MLEAVKNYFSEFKIMKTVSKDFWLVNAIQFFDGLAYFAVIIIISLYLTDNVGFSDMEAGAWQGIFFLFITAFMFSVGSVCDTLGVKKTFYVASALLALSRLGMGIAPLFLTGNLLKYLVMALLLVMALGTAMLVTNTNAALRHFTTSENRATGFNVYYLIMNIGAAIAGFGVTDGFRNFFGPVRGNLVILDFSFGMAVITFICAVMISKKHDAAAIAEQAGTPQKTPLQIFLEVWKESAFQKLVLFLVLTLGVRLVFTHQTMVMPKYYIRTLYNDFQLGSVNSLNPAIIVIGLILVIPIINKFNIVKLLVVGMTISALSLLFLAVPNGWIMTIPGIHNLNQAYFFIIVAQIVVFAIGELIFSPRFVEYVASVAPKDKVAAYMGLSALPMFIARPINGFVSGLLISSFAYDGIRAKIDTGNVSYFQSPEWMWMIYFLLAAVSPIAIVLFRGSVTSKTTDDENGAGEKKKTPAAEEASH